MENAWPAHDRNNNEIFKCPGNTSSEAWRYFGFYLKPECRGLAPTKENLDTSKATCRICFKTYSNKGNTTNLQKHIEKAHNTGRKRPSSTTPEGSESDPILKQPKLSFERSYSVTKTMPPEKKKRADDLLSRLIVGKALPFSLSNSMYFRDFCAELNEGYSVPGKPAVEKNISQKHRDMTAKVQNDIKNNYVSLTHDGWTSINNESYDTVTAHVITEDFELKSAVLDTRKIHGQHTSENIMGNLINTLESWNIKKDQVACVTTDNAANEVKAIKLSGFLRFGCYGHRINLIVKKSLLTNEIHEILKKSRKLITFFHHSSSMNDLLILKQKDPGICRNEKHIGHKLVIDCPTRWNSTLVMLERLVEQLPYIHAVANDKSINAKVNSTLHSNILTYDEVNLVNELIVILQPFEKATEILCAESVPTIHKVITAKVKIMKCIKVNDSDCDIIKNIKSKMIEEIDNRTENEDVALLGAVLNPHTKDLVFLSDSEKENARQILIDNVKLVCEVKVKEEPDAESLPQVPDLPEAPDILRSQETETQSEAKVTFKDCDEWLQDVIITGESTVNVQDSINEEVYNYLKYQRSQEDAKLTLLDWWKDKHFVYPRLAKLARKVLAIPASSVPSERVFSTAGVVVNKKRSRLLPEIVNQLVFMKMNMDK